VDYSQLPTTLPADALRRECAALIDALREERAGCERLMALNADERAALISGCIDELARVVEEKERLINLIGRLEGDCSRLTRGWARRLGVLSLGPRFERLLPLLDPDQREDLTTVSDGLALLARNVAGGNQANCALLSDFLRVTSELLHGLLTIGYSDRGYSAAGQPQADLAVAPASINCRA
jgi:hypothetical protein